MKLHRTQMFSVLEHIELSDQKEQHVNLVLQKLSYEQCYGIHAEILPDNWLDLVLPVKVIVKLDGQRNITQILVWDI